MLKKKSSSSQVTETQNIASVYYNPKSIFSTISGSSHGITMTGKNDLELAIAFHDSRSSGITDADNFVRNAGAVQLFSTKNDKVTAAISAISESIKTSMGKNQETLGSLGHSERILMRDILDMYIKENGHDKEFLPPSARSRSSSDKDTKAEVFRALTNDAYEYKIYLIARNNIVKMWSELTACKRDTYKPQKGEGGYCFDFINAIFPQGSQFGYIAEGQKSWGFPDQMAADKKSIFTELRNAKKAYDDPKQTGESNTDKSTDHDITPPLGKLQKPVRENSHDVLPNSTGEDESAEVQKLVAGATKSLADLTLKKSSVQQRSPSTEGADNDKDDLQQDVTTGLGNVLGGVDQGNYETHRSSDEGSQLSGESSVISDDLGS